MDIETLHAYCVGKKGAEAAFPFDETTLVFKVMGKIFALTSLDKSKFTVNLKCDPERAVELREQYPEIQPGYHMSKKHWNTVDFEGSLSERFLMELIDHSYNLVVAGLPLKVRKVLNEQGRGA